MVDKWIAKLHCRYCGNRWEVTIERHCAPRYTEEGENRMKGMFFAPEISRSPGMLYEECKNCGCYGGVELHSGD